MLRESATLMRVALLALAVAVPWGVLSAVAAGGGDRLRTFLGLLAGAFFLGSALVVESRELRFDAAHRVLHWRRSRLTGSRSGTLPFSAIKAVVAQQRREDLSRRTRRFSYRPVLLTEDGELALSNVRSHRAEDFADLLAQVRGIVGVD